MKVILIVKKYIATIMQLRMMSSLQNIFDDLTYLLSIALLLQRGEHNHCLKYLFPEEDLNYYIVTDICLSVYVCMYVCMYVCR